MSTMRPLVQHDDAVGALHGGQAVRDDQRRAVRHRRFAARPAPCARSRRRARWWPRRAAAAAGSSASRARCDALALAARQPHAALAQVGVVAVGQRADEVVREGRRAPPRSPRRRWRRGGRSGCSPARWWRTPCCPAARCRCAGAGRPAMPRAPARRRVARCPLARRRSAAAAGTPCSCRRRWGRPAPRSRRPRRSARSRAARRGAAATDSGS